MDPQKHGLQPYGCGCVLFRDPAVGSFYKHDSPYTCFSSAKLQLGEISLECSRPGTSAVALWATQQLFPLQKGGQFAAWLDQSLPAADDLWRRLNDSPSFQPVVRPELDIVVYAVLADSASAASEAARKVFRLAAHQELHLALMEVPVELVTNAAPGMLTDAASVTCLRSVMMKPEHRDWLDRITGILETSAAA